MRNDKNDCGSVDLAKSQAPPAQSDAGESAPAPPASIIISRLLKSRGFLDQEQLLVVLGLEESETSQDRIARVQRVASKLGYAVESLGLHSNSALVSSS